MKKLISIIISFMLTVSMLSACETDSSPIETSAPKGQDSVDAQFEDEEIFTYYVMEKVPFDNCGLKIEIKDGDDGFVRFTRVTLEGTDTVDYYTFMPGHEIFEKYTYVSAMGTAYYYTFDIESGNLLKIEDGNREDRSEATKSSGRWDNAELTVKTEVEALEAFFYGMTRTSISEAVYGESPTDIKIINGILTFYVTEKLPFDNCGLKIEIKTGENGFVRFTKATLEGTDTLDYYMFMPGEGIFEKYTYVSAMGTAYYYTLDLESNELVKIEDGNRDDRSESTKSSGRWDGAAKTVKGERAALEAFFYGLAGINLYDACAGTFISK